MRGGMSRLGQAILLNQPPCLSCPRLVTPLDLAVWCAALLPYMCGYFGGAASITLGPDVHRTLR